MLNFENLSVIFDNLSAYLFAGQVMTAIVITILWVVLLSLNGVRLEFSVLFGLPVLTMFSLAGYLGAYGWVVNIFLLIIAFFYGYALIKIVN